MMQTAELLKKVRRIQIRTAHVVNEALAGQYHSAFKGRGMEFEEVRPYQIGDDVRTIDWNVSARFGQPFVKIFKEERELTVMLLVDLSRSQDFGTHGQLKRELVAELGATLAFSAIKNNDKVGLILFTDGVEKFVTPRKGSRHVLRVVRELLAFQPRGRGTDIAAALEHLNHVVRRKAVVFLISDFLDRSAYETPLRIARRRHDLILVDVSDRRELAFPKVGLIELRDNETGRRAVVDTASAAWRKRYEELMATESAHREQTFRRSRIDCIEVRTGQPYVEELVKFFRKREVRR
jgi:uncharacterized protein (DUF58 family)